MFKSVIYLVVGGYVAGFINDWKNKCESYLELTNHRRFTYNRYALSFYM